MSKRSTVVDDFDDEDGHVHQMPKTSVIDDEYDEEQEEEEEEDDLVEPVAWDGVENEGEGDGDEEDEQDEEDYDDDARQVIDLTDGQEEDHAIYDLGEENMDENDEDDDEEEGYDEEEEDDAVYVYVVIHDKVPLIADHEKQDTHIVGIYTTLESATISIRTYILAFFEPEDVDFEEDEERDFTDNPFIRAELEDTNGCNDRVYIDIHRLHV